MVSVRVPPLIGPASLVQVGLARQRVAQADAVGRPRPGVAHRDREAHRVGGVTVPLPDSVIVSRGASTVSVAEPLAAGPLVGVTVALLFSVAL